MIRVDSDREALDLMLAIANGHPTFFPFTIPPRRVLDLGCGDGAWILHTANLWDVSPSLIVLPVNYTYSPSRPWKIVHSICWP